MKIVKGLLIIFCVALSLATFGCSKDNVEQKDTKAEKEQTQQAERPKKGKEYGFTQPVDFSGLYITCTDAKYLEDEAGHRDSVLKLGFEVQNNTTTTQIFTTINMEIKNSKGDKLNIYPGENMGVKLKPGEKANGFGYFEADGSAPYTVIYKDDDSSLSGTWKIKI
ncbi:hypothetical protein [Listeria booriae]|uniref:DUF4352 domain-containing protein n=1 Tax=Listeria booriae TaxID=1552123 RepID=A0A841ZXQ1_9LIST|nr:hypothetical protein [Listeria booriae]MBC1565097.1 hypothetical protein [Listeria booriae]